MATNQQRAKKGGELGANGEWYEGGKFINTIPENAKEYGSVTAKPRKVQIEPYVWVLSDRKPLFQIVGTGAVYIDRYKPELGIMPYEPAFEFTGLCGGRTKADVQAICDRFNAGERFF